MGVKSVDFADAVLYYSCCVYVCIIVLLSNCTVNSVGD